MCALTEFPRFGLGTPGECYPAARAAGARALEIDDDMPSDHSHMGFMLMAYYWEWEQAHKKFKRALELSRSNPTANVD